MRAFWATLTSKQRSEMRARHFPHIRHGLSNSPEYRIWAGMKSRCYNPKHESFRHYGARGIKVCDRWLHDFLAFLQDVGSRPSPNHSLDRIENDGNYEPGNVRWATPAEQLINRRRWSVTIRKFPDGIILAEFLRRGLKLPTRLAID